MEEIRAGDEVLVMVVDCCNKHQCHKGGCGKVEDVDDTQYGIRMPNHDYIYTAKSNVVRKAKPELPWVSTAEMEGVRIASATLKAKPEPVSKRPKLEDINERTLVKTRAGEMAFITLFMGEHKLTTKRIVDDGNLLFLCSAIYGGENSDNDVVATKLVDTQMRAIRHVMTGTEPAWDWTESMDKPEPPKEFKVGDWVEKTGGDHSGEVGQVFEICPELTYKYHVRFTNSATWLCHPKSLKPCPAPDLTLTTSEARVKLGAQDGQKVVITDKAVEL
jgi:hypothetical protein